jgi:hypothetical protein
MSINHNNPACEDPFYAPKDLFLKRNCQTVHIHRKHIYSATHCIKLKAEGIKTTQFILIKMNPFLFFIRSRFKLYCADLFN